MARSSPDTSDVYGKALLDYYQKGEAATLYLHTSYNAVEEMPVDWFFREEEDFPAIEIRALDLCKGKILDIGAGVGSHAIYLYEKGKEVHCLEQSSSCIEIMKARGLSNLLCQSIWEPIAHQYDTLLMMMNGIGIVGDMEGLRTFLREAHQWLIPNGKIIFDSSDLSYLYPDIRDQHHPYNGEIRYQYEYKGKKGDWFSWLYIDPMTMKKIAGQEGWKFQLITEDHNDQYLATLLKY
ncbi:SAM-dependent methyltransferase [Catalinimonas alkaloidigena]|uniref:class I SAM-dependent methyltransferase n=1 Tax=Catalinimonas alkaloidigena TaxID=1075417 RepID=UPI002405652D|nr:class I SAM-dependent methyltransferase [Catalinimonas alkaloidigena]MDF9797324.1 SAM-dependent methyltransferase [Catalinimonas alkaloidigena]